MLSARNNLLDSLMPASMALPSNTLTTRVRREYTPYPNAIGDEAAALVESLRVSNVTAAYHQCALHYNMQERRIGDDMFYYIAKGKGEIWVEGRIQKVRPGDCAHFRRGVLHAAKANARDPFDVIAIHYNAVVFGSLTLPQLLDFPDVFSLGENSPFEEMLLIACREFALRPPCWERGLEALATRMLLYLMRAQGDKMNASFSSTRREVERVLPALEHLRKHLDAPLCVSELARLCHFSPAQFRRVWKEALGVSPTEYSRRTRMEEAALLLRRSDETIDRIASRVGYSDPSFFAHSFKARMGLSPGKYRAMSAL